MTDHPFGLSLQNFRRAMGLDTSSEIIYANKSENLFGGEERLPTLKEAEEALKRSQFRFRRLVDSDIIGIMITSATGLVTECNNAFLNIVGYTRSDLQAGLIRWDQMTPPEHRPLDEHALRQLATAGRCDRGPHLRR